jgi:hypothetical protein
MNKDRMLKLAETIEKHGLCLTIAHLPAQEELALQPAFIAWLRQESTPELAQLYARIQRLEYEIEWGPQDMI